ncbi:hypothetical protein V501_08706 [Pseudogymnoascus sp. VKM F-4519 (FW-2642)]|nr:hypothetical protein V501_08706 [Pseudogymnoascus sp. VKM F-4519 (FW-2642)]
MPAGTNKYDNNPAGSITEQIAKEPSSKTDSTASSHPVHNDSEPKGDPVQIRHHQANPGPAIPIDFQVQQEGTKEDRAKRAAELNKK